jgi:exonuclease VII large subunit
MVRNGWFDEDCTEGTKNKNKAYRNMIQRHKKRGAKEQYTEMRKIEKKIHRKKNKEFFEEKMKQVEKLHEQKESKRMYRLVNDNGKQFKPCTTACRDSTGLILNEPSEIMEQRRQHFQNLLTDPDITSTEIAQESGEEVEKNI